MNMYEAAKAILAESGQPMHAKEIYERIVERDLFRFGAKNPVSVLSQTLREKSDAGKTTNPLFKRTGPGIYGLAEWEKGPGAKVS